VEEPAAGRRFIGAWRPAKPASDMTDEDWGAFARFVYEEVVARIKDPPPPNDHEPSP